VTRTSCGSGGEPWTAPPAARQPHPGHGSDEHREAGAASDPRRTILACTPVGEVSHASFQIL
jgi:hypothetical protein